MIKKICLSALLAAMAVSIGTAPLVKNASATDKFVAGRIGTITLNNQGWVNFTLENNLALCATAAGGSAATTYVMLSTNYLTTDVIKEYLSVINAAKLSGKTVQVRGLNNTTANEWGCRLDGFDLF